MTAYKRWLLNRDDRFGSFDCICKVLTTISMYPWSLWVDTLQLTWSGDFRTNQKSFWTLFLDMLLISRWASMAAVLFAILLTCSTSIIYATLYWNKTNRAVTSFPFFFFFNNFYILMSDVSKVILNNIEFFFSMNECISLIAK